MEASDDRYMEVVEALRKAIDVLERLRAEPPSPKRDVAIEQLSSAVISAISAMRDLGGTSTTLS